MAGVAGASGLSDPKIQLHRRLAELLPELQRTCRNCQVRLTSFIVSPTPYDQARRSSWGADHSREALAAEHVRFQEGDYIAQPWSALVEDLASTTSAGTSAGVVGSSVLTHAVARAALRKRVERSPGLTTGVPACSLLGLGRVVP